MSIKTERVLSSVHAGSVYILCRVHGVMDQCAVYIHVCNWTSSSSQTHRSCSYVLYIVSYFNTCVAHIAMHVFTFVSFCCLRLCYVHLCTIFHDSHVHATSPPCSRAVAQARPRMLCIRLVYIYCHSLGNWIGLSAPGLQFIQASYIHCRQVARRAY